MSEISILEILKYHNLARTNPKKFSQFVQVDIPNFNEEGTILPLAPGMNYRTNEGISAWKECIEFFKNAKPLPPLQLSLPLCAVAQAHADDMAKMNNQSHTGSDGSSVGDRINRRCKPINIVGSWSWGENLGGDFSHDGRDHNLNTIKGLVIDDGVPNRGHRHNMYSEKFKYVGIGWTIFKDKKIRVVLNYHTQNPQIKKQYQHEVKKTEENLEKKKEVEIKHEQVKTELKKEDKPQKKTELKNEGKTQSDQTKPNLKTQINSQTKPELKTQPNQQKKSQISFINNKKQQEKKKQQITFEMSIPRNLTPKTKQLELQKIILRIQKQVSNLKKPMMMK